MKTPKEHPFQSSDPGSMMIIPTDITCFHGDPLLPHGHFMLTVVMTTMMMRFMTYDQGL